MFKHTRTRLVALGAFALGSVVGLGCMVDDGTGDDLATLEESEATAELAIDQVQPQAQAQAAARPHVRPQADQMRAACAEFMASDDAAAIDADGAGAEKPPLSGPTNSVNQGRACVDQSSASIQYMNPDACGGWPCSCPSQLSPDSAFSRNHPVNVHYWCGPYVMVKDLWSTHYGWMREGALRNC